MVGLKINSPAFGHPGALLALPLLAVCALNREANLTGKPGSEELLIGIFHNTDSGIGHGDRQTPNIIAITT